MTDLSLLRQECGDYLVEHAPIGERTTYRVGGSARALLRLSSLQQLQGLDEAINASGLPLFLLGNGSNLLIADGEHDVLALHLEGEFQEMSVQGEGAAVIVEAGAGLDLPIAARRLAAGGITGFEWAVGVPGTFGGAAVMNAGGHGSDMAASVLTVQTWSQGLLRSWSLEELKFGYRTSALTSDDVVTSVSLHLAHGNPVAAKAQLSEIVKWRREHQPGGANAGSVFRNPEGDSAGRLIDAAGLKGLRHKSAQVSEKHANFIIADAGGSANDIWELVQIVRERVQRSSGVALHLEHRLLGFDSY